MTNKPMLSVEREVIEGICNDFEVGRHFSACEGAAKLRALLDKPAAERKPFAWYRVPKDFPLQGAFFPYIEGQSERDIQTSVEAEFGFNVKRLYDEPAAQHQGEPVAIVTGSTVQWLPGAGKLKDRAPLYAEQPAPVAHTMRSVMDAAQQARGFPVLTSNQCHALAEALNGVKP